MGSPEIIPTVFFAFVMLFIVLVSLIKYLRKRKKKKKKVSNYTKNLKNILKERESKGREKISRYEIQGRIENAKRRRRGIKISSKHFPNKPALEKQLWDKDKKPEDEKI